MLGPLANGTTVNGWIVIQRLGTSASGQSAYRIVCDVCGLVRTAEEGALRNRTVVPCPHPHHSENVTAKPIEQRTVTVLDPDLDRRMWKRWGESK